jgi:sulfite oxidase
LSGESIMLDTRENLQLLIQKHPAMTVHQEVPLNLGTLPEVVCQSFITPQERFFVRNHGPVPTIDPESYRLSITGLLKTPTSYTLSELQEAFPATTLVATVQCAGHRRDELIAVEPIRGEIAWGAEAIGTATWRGVLLQDILKATGIEEGTRHVAFTGLDEIEKEGKSTGFGGSIPIEKALDAEVLLAYEMNGESLPPLHGFPLRVIVPGYIGARSVKWLANINLQAHPSTNCYQSHAYKLFPSHIRQENADWTTAEMLGPLPLNSVISRPCEGEVLPAGSTLIQGYALTGEGRCIEHVELSIDGGETWVAASLHMDRGHRWAWRFWEAEVNLPPARYQLVVRAWGATGNTQPEDIKAVWNWKGYLNCAWHRVNIVVQ